METVSKKGSFKLIETHTSAVASVKCLVLGEEMWPLCACGELIRSVCAS